jgi:nuclear transcription factor Y gamma
MSEHVDYREHLVQQQQMDQQHMDHNQLQQGMDMQQQVLHNSSQVSLGGQQFYNAPPQSLPQHYIQDLNRYWAEVYKEIEQTKQFKTHKLPLARIKKIMKSDEDVRMISAEAPILFAKACEMFIIELTIRSWLHTEESKRRTLQRSDIATAISKTDIFDFLIDIVPREDGKPVKKDMSGRAMMTPQDLANQQYLLYMAQQQAIQQQGGSHEEGHDDKGLQQQHEYQMYQQQQQMGSTNTSTNTTRTEDEDDEEDEEDEDDEDEEE